MDGDYELVIVASCTPYRETPIFKKYATDFVWILSRTPEISEEQKLRAFNYLRDHKFDIDSLEQTPQKGETCEKFHKGEI